MDLKLSVIIVALTSFLPSLLVDGVRSFLLNKLPNKVLKYFRDRNFKHYRLSFNDMRDIKELGKYYFCSLDNKTYILNSVFLPSEIIENKPSVNLQISPRSMETVDKITEDKSGFKTSQEQTFSNKQIIKILDKFFRIDEDKRHCFLSETLYMAIKNKLQRRKIKLMICVDNEQFEKIPFKNLSERDFNCPDSKLSIEIKL